MRKSQCQCRHQISGSEGQACELRAAFEANDSWKLGWQYPIAGVFQGTILIVFNKATRCRVVNVAKRVSQSMRGDLTRARLKNPTTVQISAFSVLVFSAV